MEAEGRRRAGRVGAREGTRTYLPTGVVDVLRIICVLRSLLHCALFSAPTAYYLLALTCNCIDLQYTTRPAPPMPMDFFSLFFFEDVSGLCRGMEVCYDWPRVMEQPLMLHFGVFQRGVAIFLCLLAPRHGDFNPFSYLIAAPCRRPRLPLENWKDCDK